MQCFPGLEYNKKENTAQLLNFSYYKKPLILALSMTNISSYE